MRKRGILVIGFCMAFGAVSSVYPLNTGSIIAYPVPFNPESQTMKIGYEKGVVPDTVSSVKIEIFDINGDRVLVREYSSLASPVIWNGRNNAGSMVKSGLYIIKVTVDDSSTGAHGDKIIRILVNR